MRRWQMLAAVAALVCLAPPAASAQGVECFEELPGPVPPPQPSGRPIVFGIYPGGAAGQLTGGLVRNDPLIRRQPRQVAAALGELSGGRPFVVHIYNHFTGTPDDAPELENDAAEIDAYSRLGYEVELAVRYAPAARGGDVPGFVGHVREVVRRFGPQRALTELQVTNEANFPTPGTSDGGFEGAKDALLQGIVAADDEARRAGRRDLSVGFNWAYRLDSASERSFWTYLGERGGPAFLAALDWVGIDAYPNTLFPPAGADFREAMIEAMRVLRECYAPLAKIPGSVPLHISENGYPNGPGRSEEMQVEAMRGMLAAVADYRGNYNLTDYRWFTLRDANSDSQNPQERFGILRDDYSRKPAFEVLRRQVAALSPPARERRGARPRLKLVLRYGRGRRCARPPLRASIGGADRRRVRRVRFYVGRRRVAFDRRAPFSRRLPLGGRRGRRLSVGAAARLDDGRLGLLRRSLRLCTRRR